ncbi:MAG TPA: hypothetical protein VLA17_12430 [Candidatus Limnocylindria bacterium]|nr:hypothetical protein [Candidatus Limnocylindria bacterium]
MSDTAICDYAKARGFHAQTLERWLSWQPADRAALADLALALKMGENHLRDIMDWLDEIALRDQARIYEVLNDRAVVDISTDPRLGRADRLKRVKEQIRRVRFPRLAETEDAIRAKIRALKLHPGITLSVPQGLEGGRLQVEFSAAREAELKQLAEQLCAAIEKPVVAEIFALLSGRQAESPDV